MTLLIPLERLKKPLFAPQLVKEVGVFVSIRRRISEEGADLQELQKFVVFIWQRQQQQQKSNDGIKNKPRVSVVVPVPPTTTTTSDLRKANGVHRRGRKGFSRWLAVGNNGSDA